MIHPFVRHLLVLFVFVLAQIHTAEGDYFDDAVSAKVSQLAIRGAGITYFDANRMSAPITRGYGKLSSDDSSDDVTPDTTFMLASVSKPFAASAVAVLVDKGIISSIDDDICDVIPPDYKADNPMKLCRNPKHPTTKVTWRMILTHRSSMKRSLPSAKNSSGKWVNPTYGPSGGYISDVPAVGNPTCPLEGVADFYRALLTDDPDAQTDVGAGVQLQGGKELNWYDLAQSTGGMWHDYKPGTRQAYSNAAYGFLPALIEFAVGGGQTFPEFCHENLFGPLGMDHTAWFRKDLPDNTREALPVEKRGRGFRDIGHYCFIDYASGELRTSAKDLEAWSTAMLDYGAPALWSKAMGKEIVQCQERNGNNQPVGSKSCEFAYGWIVLDNSQKKTTSEEWLKQGFQNYDWTDGIWHDGSEAGSQTNILILPKAGLFVSVLSNTDLNSPTAAQQLTQAIVEAPLPSSTNCPTGETKFVLSLQTDKFPKETKWTLRRNNKKIRFKRYKTYQKPFTNYQESICIPKTGTYRFIIQDRYGDGICCSEGKGSYEISVDGTVKRSGGKFNKREVTSWSN